jgi:alkylation response protein AidB-like acyl-CoA dehydrogenase
LGYYIDCPQEVNLLFPIWILHCHRSGIILNTIFQEAAMTDLPIFPLTDEHKMIRDAARDFAQKEISPIAAEFDESGEFPHATVKKMGELGFMGIEVPEQFGGAEMDTLAYVLALEEICKVDASHGVIMSVNNSLYCHGILKFGAEEQKKNFITPIASGKAIGAYSLTEPQSGSDAGTMKSRAIRDGDFYVLNGRKSWVTSGPVADYFVVFMMTNPDKKQKGVSAFLVDGKTKGLIRGKKEPKLGIRASATSELIFEDCRIPVENRLGAEGEGFKIAMTVLDAGRIGIATQALGIAESAYEAARQYAGQREAFGQPIGAFQGTGFKIADMKTRIEASRLLIYNAAIAKENSKKSGGRYSLEASMAKLFASETAMFVTHQSLQIHGGMGYSKELPVERYFRDAKITEIYEGTSEIQRLVISRSELGIK